MIVAQFPSIRTDLVRGISIYSVERWVQQDMGNVLEE